MSKVTPKQTQQVETIPQIIDRLFSARTYITTAEVAVEAGVTRQPAHYHLARMTLNGELVKRARDVLAAIDEAQHANAPMR